MKFQDLKGRDVVGVAEAHKLGTVNNLVLDLQPPTVRALLVKTGGLFSSDQALLLSDIKSIGADAVTIPDASRLNDQNKFGDLKGRPTLDAVLGGKVMSEDGTTVGTVSDVDIDIATGVVNEFILREGLVDRLRGQELYVSASDVRSVGEKLVVVAAQAAAEE